MIYTVGDCIGDMGPVPTQATLGFLNHVLLESQADLGQQPWWNVRKALWGVKHDVIYNNSLEAGLPKDVAGVNADLGIWNFGPGELLDWDGAVNLWQYADWAVHNGGVIDFVGNQNETIKTINAIIDATHIPANQVWSFYTNLDRLNRESGNPNLLRPDLMKKQSPKPEPESDLKKYLWWGAAFLVGGIILTHELNKA